MRAALGDSLDGSGGEGEDYGLFKFRHVNALFLEIGVFPDIAGRVELGSASPVGVASAHFRALI